MGRLHKVKEEEINKTDLIYEYNHNDIFKRYVDRYKRDNNLDLSEALDHYIVKTYYLSIQTDDAE